MISVKEALAGAIAVAAFGIAGIALITYLSLHTIEEAYDDLDATRVALRTERVSHDKTLTKLGDTRIELADTLVELGDTLVELGECENKPTN